MASDQMAAEQMESIPDAATRIETIEMHTGGEPVRIVTAGYPRIEGKTLLEKRRFAREPALAIEHGRPTKRGRRELDEAQRQGWGDRWSASIDDETPQKR